MAGSDRTISVLKLFTLDRSGWTVEEVAMALQVSVSSAYRYVAALTEAGLLTTSASGHYILGPAIIQYDRQIQLTDPLLRVAKPIMAEIMRFAPAGSTVLLCRIFRETVLCVHQVAEAAEARVSYERGRPMPLFRGATSKIILAYLPLRDLRRLYEVHRAQITEAALGDAWEAFRRAMAEMRKAGHAITYAEVDPERIGIAVAILDDHRRVLGSLSYVIPASEERAIARLVSLAATGAREIEQGMRADADASASTRGFVMEHEAHSGLEHADMLAPAAD
jgi:DNA-binding IclR family transcriptional regulator